VKELWIKLTRQGTSEEHSIHEDRSIILSNQLAIILSALTIVLTGIILTMFGLSITTPFLVLIIFSFLVIPVFNHYRWISFSRILLSIIVPVLSMVLTLLTKRNENTEVFEYFDTRIFILISAVIPAVIFPIEDRWKLAISLLISFLLLVFFDPIHNLFGMGFYQKGFVSENYSFINVVSITSYLFLVGSVIFLKSVIQAREIEKGALFERLNIQNVELIKRNAAVEKHQEELMRAKDLIENQKLELTRKNQELESAINEKTRDLLKTNKELIQYNNELRQFSYTISHNLRAPVASLIGLTNIVQRDNLSEENNTIMDHVKRSAENLDAVFKDLNKIIDLRSSLTTVKEKVVLSKELSEIKQSLNNELKDGETKFKEDLGIDVIYSIRPFINSILYNLISNAIKYRAKGRALAIKVGSKKVSEDVILTVTDNGIGMDLDLHKDDIFKMYKRFNLHTEGKGLGLYLVKLQTEALAGEIDVVSRPNYGTVFTLKLKNVINIKDQTVFENDYARVFFDAYTNTTGIIWKRNVNSEEYRNMFIKNLEIFRNYKTPFWISDMRTLDKVSPEDHKWLIESIIPEATEYGLKKIAMIIHDDESHMVQKSYSEMFANVFTEFEVETAHFNSMDSGRNWLAE